MMHNSDIQSLVNIHHGSSSLLDLPPEIRSQIWALAFENHHLSPSQSSHYSCQFDPQCTSCNGILEKRKRTHVEQIEPYNNAFNLLLTCKEIYLEARHFFFSTLTLHVVSPLAFGPPMSYCLHLPSHPQPPNGIIALAPKSLLSKITKLTLYIHLTEESRQDWMTKLTKLTTYFPNLAHLTVYSHMRSPTSYDKLIDSIYLAGPLVMLPDTLKRTLHFDYYREEVMFESRELGDIMSSSALEEHEAVIREVLTDDNFRQAAGQGDLTGMMVAMVAVARTHEQAWIEGLRRRMMAQHQE